MQKLLLIALISTSVLVGCKKEATVWDTDWNAPIINDTLSLINLVNDSTLAVNNGVYEVDLNRSLFDLNINDVITFPDTTISVSYTIPFAFFNVPPGYSFVNEADEYSFAIQDLELKKVRLSAGFIDVEVRNPAPTKAFFNLKMPGVTLNGVEFDETLVAPAKENGTAGVIQGSIDLAGHTMDLTGVDGNTRNTLRADVDVKSDPDGPPVTLYNTDLIVVKVTLRDVKVDYAKGYFGQRVISDTTDLSIDVLNLIQSGSIDLPASTIKFEVENGVKVGANALLTNIISENNSGSTVNLSHPQMGSTFNIDPATGTWNSLVPSFKSLEFNATNSNIEAYLENLGAKNTIGYKVVLNPWGNVSGGSDELFPQSKLRVNLHANLPLTIGTDQLVVRDTFDFNVQQDTDKTHLVSGELRLRARNSFPYSASVKLVLIDVNGTELYTLTGNSLIQSGLFGTLENSTNQLVAESELMFVLSDEIISNLDKIKGIIVESEFNSLDPATNLSAPQSIQEGAFLGVKLNGRFKTENIF